MSGDLALLFRSARRLSWGVDMASRKEQLRFRSAFDDQEESERFRSWRARYLKMGVTKMNRQQPVDSGSEQPRALLAGGLALMALALPLSLRAQRPPEPRATPGVELTNISNVEHDKFTSVFP